VEHLETATKRLASRGHIAKRPTRRPTEHSKPGGLGGWLAAERAAIRVHSVCNNLSEPSTERERAPTEARAVPSKGQPQRDETSTRFVVAILHIRGSSMVEALNRYATARTFPIANDDGSALSSADRRRPGIRIWKTRRCWVWARDGEDRVIHDAVTCRTFARSLEPCKATP
jgi:hypothetical protein